MRGKLLNYAMGVGGMGGPLLFMSSWTLVFSLMLPIMDWTETLSTVMAFEAELGTAGRVLVLIAYVLGETSVGSLMLA